MKKGVIIAIVAVILAIIVIAVGIVFGLQMAKGNNSGDSEDLSNKAIFKHDAGEMYSNLSESKKIVKITATVETTDEKFQEALEEKNYIIRNEINEIIRSKKEDEVNSSEGQKNLQKQIVTRLNEVFNTKAISDVYFNDFIVQ